MYNFKGFTEKANLVLNTAIETAGNMGHTYIGSEHLLIGLLEVKSGIAYDALSVYDLTAQTVADAIKNSVGVGQPTKLSHNDLTPRCKHMLEDRINCHCRNLYIK